MQWSDRQSQTLEARPEAGFPLQRYVLAATGLGAGRVGVTLRRLRQVFPALTQKRGIPCHADIKVSSGSAAVPANSGTWARSKLPVNPGSTPTTKAFSGRVEFSMPR